MDKTVLSLDQKMAEINKKIDQLATLQVTTGGIPADLDPADEATLAQFRENDPDTVRVMEAIAAPLYSKFANLEDRLNGVITQVGTFLNETRQEKVLGEVYAKVPKDKMDQVVDSPEFISWLADVPEPLQSSYIDIFNSTAKYTSKAALRALRDFARDTGTDLGLEDQPTRRQEPSRERPQMPTSPAFRSGSALPPPAPAKPVQATATTPLSPAELAEWQTSMNNARSEGERDLLRARLRITPLDFGGVDTSTRDNRFGNQGFRS